MWFSSDDRGDRIFVRGEFVSPRLLLIHATVARESGIHAAMGAASNWRTLRDLWQGIRHESRVGRRLGAVEIRVVFDGDQDIAGLFTANELPDRSPVQFSLRPVLVPPSRHPL